MSKGITAVCAAALALALGCEQPTQSRDENEPRTEDRLNTEFEQAPGEEPQQQERQHQQRQQQQGQQQGQMGVGAAGQIVTVQSENSLNRTVAALNRGLRENDLEVVTTVRFTEQMRRRAMRAMENRQEQQAQQGQQQGMQQEQQGMQEGQQGMQQQGMQQGQGEQIGDVRLIVFRRPDVESQAIEQQGPEALLKTPRAVLVYERGEQVVVAYRQPEEMLAVGMHEPTAQILSRVVREAAGGRQQQPTAQADQQQQAEQQQAEQEAQQAEQHAMQAEQEAQQADQEAQQMEQQARAGAETERVEVDIEEEPAI